MRKPDLRTPDPTLFAERLQRGLEALAQTLKRPGFGGGDATIGAELEVSLIDSEGVGRGTTRAYKRFAIRRGGLGEAPAASNPQARNASHSM